MSSVAEHYASHLAPIYLWMAGGLESAVSRGRLEVEQCVPRPIANQRAVDLGAGFGMHSIPLADLGYSVTAIDNTVLLLETLQRQIEARSIKPVNDDLLSFKRHLDGPAALIVCMGDTLTHLPDRSCVERLFVDIADSLEEGGNFLATFRDYSTPLSGTDRFIPVRSDADRILTCFLEYDEDSVTVHDILHERRASAWQERVSAYRKLRLSTEWVARALEANGFQVRRGRPRRHDADNCEATALRELATAGRRAAPAGATPLSTNCPEARTFASLISIDEWSITTASGGGRDDAPSSSTGKFLEKAESSCRWMRDRPATHGLRLWRQ
jgi:SAM-dependent methyltransferase